MNQASDKSSILIIGDSPDSVSAMVCLLAGDHDMLTAFSLDAALSHLQNDQIALILLDTANSSAIMTRIKSDQQTADIPVIALTANRDNSNEDAALAAGAADFIHKPINPSVIRNRVAFHLQWNSRERALRELNTELQSKIAESIALQATLEKANARFQDFSRSSADWYWETDSAHRFVWVSENTGELLGIANSDLIGKRRDELSLATNLNSSDIWQDYLATLDRHEPFRCFEYCLRNIRGELQWLSISGVPFFSSDKVFCGYRGVGQVVTEKRARDDELARYRSNLEQQVAARTGDLIARESLLRTMLTTMMDGLLHIDALGRILMANEVALTVFAYREAPGQLIGRHIGKLMPGSVIDQYLTHPEAFDSEAVSKILGNRLIVVGVKRDGSSFPLEIAFQSMTDDKGNRSFIGTIRDQTEQQAFEKAREEARAQALELAQVKSDFLASMSHEIRTPMNAIIGMSELCMSTELNQRQRNYLGKIKVASESLLHVINDILDFSKIEAGKMLIEQVPFVLESVFDQLSSVLAHIAERKSIELLFDIEGNTHFLIGDPMRLGQVLTNIVNNSLKFSDHGSVVVSSRVTRLAPPDIEIEFSIKDQGIGISPEQMNQLFQPFTQADSSTTRKYGGTGLGLTISRHLVEKMGGRIWAESTVGEGTTFHFTTQLTIKGADRRQGILAFAEKLGETQDRTVLVVDDNAIAGNILKRLVEAIGVKVEYVQSARDALAFVKNNASTSLLGCLIDWHMPEIDGIECIRRLRAHFKALGGNVPRMLLATAYTNDGELEQYKDEIDGLISKPFSARNLYVEIASMLGVAQPSLPNLERRQAKEALQWTPFRGLDILLAEDIEVNREVISELLANVGISIRLANNGVEALAEVRKRIPDLILMDCHMPELDGYATTQELRRQPATQHLPIIALTANASIADQEKCFAAGMNAHVAKPVRMEALHAQMLRCLPSPEECPPFRTKSAPVMPAEENVAQLAFAGIDTALALKHVGNSEKLLRKILKQFRDDLGGRFTDEFDAAFSAGDWQKMLLLAHSLKGVASTIGASELLPLAIDLQSAAEMKDALICAEKRPAVVRALQTVLTGLKSIP